MENIKMTCQCGASIEAPMLCNSTLNRWMDDHKGCVKDNAIHLTEEEAKRFWEALEHPPEPSAKLKEAVARAGDVAQDILNRINPENLHPETKTGPDVGREKECPRVPTYCPFCGNNAYLYPIDERMDNYACEHCRGTFHTAAINTTTKKRDYCPPNYCPVCGRRGMEEVDDEEGVYRCTVCSHYCQMW